MSGRSLSVDAWGPVSLRQGRLNLNLCTPTIPACVVRTASGMACGSFSARRTEADYQAWRDQRDWTERKYYTGDRGSVAGHKNPKPTYFVQNSLKIKLLIIVTSLLTMIDLAPSVTVRSIAQ